MDVFLARLTLLMPAFSLPVAPLLLTEQLHSSGNAPLPFQQAGIHSFGDRLKPRWIVGAEPLNQ